MILSVRLAVGSRRSPEHHISPYIPSNKRGIHEHHLGAQRFHTYNTTGRPRCSPLLLVPVAHLASLACKTEPGLGPHRRGTNIFSTRLDIPTRAEWVSFRLAGKHTLVLCIEDEHRSQSTNREEALMPYPPRFGQL